MTMRSDVTGVPSGAMATAHLVRRWQAEKTYGAGKTNLRL